MQIYAFPSGEGVNEQFGLQKRDVMALGLMSDLLPFIIPLFPRSSLDNQAWEELFQRAYFLADLMIVVSENP